MALPNTLISCPEGCDDDLLLPAIDANQDCTTYEQTLSQISDLWIRPNSATEGEVFTSWSTTPTFTTGAVDNTTTDNSTAKWLVGIGEIPEPEETVDEYPKDKERVTKRTYELTFRILNMSDAMYEFCRQFQCGWTDFTFHYADLGGSVYGTSTGLVPKSAKTTFPHGGGVTDKNLCIFKIKWVANGDPERRVNPGA